MHIKALCHDTPTTPHWNTTHPQTIEARAQRAMLFEAELSAALLEESWPDYRELAAARLQEQEANTPLPERVWALRNVARTLALGGEGERSRARGLLEQAVGLKQVFCGAPSHPGRVCILLLLCFHQAVIPASVAEIPCSVDCHVYMSLGVACVRVSTHPAVAVAVHSTHTHCHTRTLSLTVCLIPWWSNIWSNATLSNFDHRLSDDTGSLPELLSLFQLLASDARWEVEAAQSARNVLQLVGVVAGRYTQENDTLSAVILLVRVAGKRKHPGLGGGMPMAMGATSSKHDDDA